MKRVLVVGGTGFVGRYLVNALVRRGVFCRVVVHQTDPTGVADSALVESVSADVTCPETLIGLAKDIDTVYNLASVGHVSALSQEAYETFHRINVQGAENLARICAMHPIKRFVHFSSTAAVGRIRSQTIDEQVRPYPRTPYQHSKRLGEISLLRIQAETGLPVVILRPCMIYGPGGTGEFLKLCRLMSKGLFPRVGLGKNLTPIVHVEDVVSAAMLAGVRGKPGETYLIASKRSPEMAEIQKIVTRELGVWQPYWYVPTWVLLAGASMVELFARCQHRVPLVTRANILSTVASRQFSIEKAERELGYAPQVSLEHGIAETIQWYRAQGLL